MARKIDVQRYVFDSLDWYFKKLERELFGRQQLIWAQPPIQTGAIKPSRNVSDRVIRDW